MLESLLAWLWAPVVLYVLALGLGLLAERVLRLELPNALVAPVGMAVAIVLVVPVYRIGIGAAGATPLLVVLAIAGLALARRDLLRRANPGAAGIAAVAAYGLYLAPVILSGHWTWPGYNFVNDTASNLVFADLLEHHGFTRPSAADSTTAAIQALPAGEGYPVGAHALLATVRPLTGAPLAAVYQPVVGAVAGLAAMSLAHLARRAGLASAPAAAAGFLAVGGALLYRYGLHGGIKEVAVVALLGTAAGVGVETVAGGLKVRAVVLLAVCALPLVLVFGAAGAPYGLVLAVLVLASALASRDRPSRAHVARVAAVGAAVALVAAAPTLSQTVDFGRSASDAFANTGGASTAYLGQLVRPLPAVQSAGVWFADDYRGEADPGWGTRNAIAIAVVLALALAGVAAELRRRRPAGVLLLGTAAVPAAALAPYLSPYADAKLLVVLTPAVVLMAAIGAFTLLRSARLPMRGLGAAGALVLTLGVLYSDALAYRVTQLAPPDRVAAMTDAAVHARGGGLWLVNEWEEYAKYFMRRIRINAAFESFSPRPARLRRPGPIFGRYYDLDMERVGYVTSFPGIIKRRAPDASRPPAAFRKVYENRYYEVWRRAAGIDVRGHIPLQRLFDPTGIPSCAAVRRLARRAGPDDVLVAARRAAVPQLDVASIARPRLWTRRSGLPGVAVPTVPGTVEGSVATRSGRHRIWLEGSFGRPTSVRVDGELVGAADEVNGPGQWAELGTVRLRAGRHGVEVVRPSGALGPGNRYFGQVGPVALEPIRPERLVTVPPERARSLCGRAWDWIELVRGRPA
jgi:hypothetical protein